MKWPRIPTAEINCIVPLGLSQYKGGYRLLVPLWFWRRTDVLPMSGDEASGWWNFRTCIRLERGRCTIMWGWTFMRGTIKPWAYPL